MTIDNLVNFVRTQSKYDLSGIKNTYLEKQIDTHRQKAGMDNYQAFYELLLRDQKTLNKLLDACLNNATRYFRKPQLFEVLAEDYLPDLIQQKIDTLQPLNIWITACSTGDEAYSLAITIHELLAKQSSKVTVNMLATDLSQEAIQTASEGYAIDNNLISLPTHQRKQYFTYKEGCYWVKPIIRDYVKFEIHDFLNPSAYSLSLARDFDLIICRNALLYYELEFQEKTIQYLYNHLITNGLLILSEFELMPVSCAALFTKSAKAPYIYSKNKAPLNLIKDAFK